MTVIYWIAIMAVLLVMEILTFGLTTIWFAGGAAVAALAAWLGCPLSVQIILFVAVSLLLLLITRPLAVRHVNRKAIRTNADSLIGVECIVTSPIDNLRGKGEANVHGSVWSARGAAGYEYIPKGTTVRIEKIAGVKVIVKPAEELINPENME